MIAGAGTVGVVVEERLEDRLAEQVEAQRQRNSIIETIAFGKPNRIDSVSPQGVWLSTEESDRKGRGPQLVPAWMLNVAWNHLRATGTLSARYLVATDGLNAKRSSAVCAILACIVGVEVASKRPIILRFAGDTTR